MVRSLALAKSMLAVDTSSKPCFLLDDDGTDWIDAVEAAGFTHVAGTSPAGEWTGAVLDGYAFTSYEIESLRKTIGGGPLVCIEEAGDAVDHADLIVDYGCHRSGDTAAGKPALLGPTYALLDDRFADVPARPVPPAASSVLVTFGAFDSVNATGLALDALAEIAPDAAAIRVTIAIGGRSPHRDEIERRVGAFPGDVALLVDAGDMAGLLGDADLVVGSGGVSLIERMALGVPSVTVAQNDVQVAGIAGAARENATRFAGKIDDLTPEGLAGELAALIADASARKAMSDAGRKLVDGRGARRVAEHLCGLIARPPVAANAGT
ncbi:MAG: glycosyltransferase [Rhodospirillales bacterium]